MTTPSAGRFVLRFVRRDDAAVTYEGQFEVGEMRTPCTARIALPGGAVDIDPAGPAVPSWLVDQAKAVLRTAFRGARSGVPWPRRIHRFRQSREDGEDA